MKVLLLGCEGQLGRCLVDQLAITDHEVIRSSRVEIDITNLQLTENLIRQIGPDVVINASGFTAVDKAEINREVANLVNHIAVANIAGICRKLDCWLIHVSTDYVFDGKSSKPYKEADQTNPQTIYGLTKLEGERAIQDAGCRHIVIRTSWVFSEYGNNFLKTILQLGAERDTVDIVSDQIGCPTYAQDLAKTIVIVLKYLLEGKKYSGLYHYSGNSSCSWYEFAKVIYEQATYLSFKTPSFINSVPTSAYPTRAIRPSYSVLDCSKIDHNFGVKSSDWHMGLLEVLKKLKH